MSSFEDIHAGEITGSLAMFDRLIFRGHLRRLHVAGGMRAFLWSQGVPLTRFGPYVQRITHELLDHAESLAAQAGRPSIYLPASVTRTSGQTKDEMARSIAERDGITEGLVCVLRAVEPATTFRLTRPTGELSIGRHQGRHLHLYFYFVMRETQTVMARQLLVGSG